MKNIATIEINEDERGPVLTILRGNFAGIEQIEFSMSVLRKLGRRFHWTNKVIHAQPSKAPRSIGEHSETEEVSRGK